MLSRIGHNLSISTVVNFIHIYCCGDHTIINSDNIDNKNKNRIIIIIIIIIIIVIIIIIID